MDYQELLIEWLRNGLKKPGKTGVELSRLLGKDKNVVSKILNSSRDIIAHEIPIISSYIGEAAPLTFQQNGAKSYRVREHISQRSQEFGPDTVPILGHANGSNEAILISPGNEIGRAPRHPRQQEVREAFALYAIGESMSPRYRAGELIYVAANQPPLSGQDCVVETTENEGFLKEFVRRTDKEVVCRQLNPAKEWRRSVAEIKAVHAVVGRG